MGQLVFLAQFGVLARTAQRGWWWWWWWRAPVDCRTNWPMIGCGGRRRQVLEGKVLHVAVVALGIRFQLHPSVSGYQSKCGLCSSFSSYSSSSSSSSDPGYGSEEVRRQGARNGISLFMNIHMYRERERERTIRRVTSRETGILQGPRACSFFSLLIQALIRKFR